MHYLPLQQGQGEAFSTDRSIHIFTELGHNKAYPRQFF